MAKELHIFSFKNLFWSYILFMSAFDFVFLIRLVKVLPLVFLRTIFWNYWWIQLYFLTSFLIFFYLLRVYFSSFLNWKLNWITSSLTRLLVNEFRATDFPLSADLISSIGFHIQGSNWRSLKYCSLKFSLWLPHLT